MKTRIITVPPSKEPTRVVCRVFDLRGDRVRFGWNADPTVEMHRHEVMEAIRRENIAAANAEKVKS